MEKSGVGRTLASRLSAYNEKERIRKLLLRERLQRVVDGADLPKLYRPRPFASSWRPLPPSSELPVLRSLTCSWSLYIIKPPNNVKKEKRSFSRSSAQRVNMNSPSPRDLLINQNHPDLLQDLTPPVIRQSRISTHHQTSVLSDRYQCQTTSETNRNKNALVRCRWREGRLKFGEQPSSGVEDDSVDVFAGFFDGERLFGLWCR